MNLSEIFPVEIKLEKGKFITKYARINIRPAFVMTVSSKLIQVMYKGNGKDCPLGIILKVMERSGEREIIEKANAFAYYKEYPVENGQNGYNRHAYLRLKSIPGVAAEAEREKIRELKIV